LPVLKQKLLDKARGLRAYLISNPAGTERSTAGARVGASEGFRPPGQDGNQAQGLEQGEQRVKKQREQIKKQREQIKKQREQMKKQSRELKELRENLAESVHGTGYHGINPANVIWMLGTARTGSTWLASMMEELEDHTVWREPYVGQLFGGLYYNWVGEKHFETKHFILGRRSKESWVKSVRTFILNEASLRFPGVGDEGYLVIREPNGSIGAPLLMEALPESRMIFLIRDPRDVIASALDAAKKGSWLYKRRIEQGAGRAGRFDMPAEELVESTATMYLRNVGNSKEAFDAHEGPKALVRYEELRADTLGTMRRMYAGLGIEVDEAELARAVQEHAWENVPEEEKGEGKFHRKATPGGWREDLTEEQAEAVERITSPLLEEFYP
jgi:hypothetical protein